MSVSVVIPAYNHAGYLTKAICSAQAAGAREVIVINDGSTDNTLTVLEAFADEPNVKVMTQTNMGCAAARNNGFLAATGDLIFFLDADDELFPDALTKLKKAFENAPTNVGLGCGWVELIDPEGTPIHQIQHPQWAILQAPEWFCPNSGNFALLRAWGQRLVDAEGFLYNPRYKNLSENAVVWTRLFARGCKALMLPEFTVKYRQHPYSGGSRSTILTNTDPRQAAWDLYDSLGFNGRRAKAISMLTKLKRWHPQYGVSTPYLEEVFKMPWFSHYAEAVCDCYAPSLSSEQRAYWGGLLSFFAEIHGSNAAPATIDLLKSMVA